MLKDPSGVPYYTDELLLEVIRKRMEPGFSLPHHEGFTSEDYILKIIRQVEQNAFVMTKMDGDSPIW